MSHNRPMLTRTQLAALLRDVNVEALAAEAGISTKTVYRLRHQKTSPTLDTLQAIVEALAKLKRAHGSRRVASRRSSKAA